MTARYDQPLPILVDHYGQKYADAYRAVVDTLPTRNGAERKTRGDVAHFYAVQVCRADASTTSDLLTLAAYAVGYAESQTSWGAGNARAATAYAALVCELAGCDRVRLVTA